MKLLVFKETAHKSINRSIHLTHQENQEQPKHELALTPVTEQSSWSTATCAYTCIAFRKNWPLCKVSASSHSSMQASAMSTKSLVHSPDNNELVPYHSCWHKYGGIGQACCWQNCSKEVMRKRKRTMQKAHSTPKQTAVTKWSSKNQMLRDWDGSTCTPKEILSVPLVNTLCLSLSLSLNPSS